MAYKSHMLQSNWFSDIGNKVKDTAHSIARGVGTAKGIFDAAKTVYNVGKTVAPFVTPFLL